MPRPDRHQSRHLMEFKLINIVNISPSPITRHEERAHSRTRLQYRISRTRTKLKVGDVGNGRSNTFKISDHRGPPDTDFRKRTRHRSRRRLLQGYIWLNLAFSFNFYWNIRINLFNFLPMVVFKPVIKIGFVVIANITNKREVKVLLNL